MHLTRCQVLPLPVVLLVVLVVVRLMALRVFVVHTLWTTLTFLPRRACRSPRWQ
jgi:hypothetical protein